ncbi:MAG TPA: VanW family protein [Polyangiaceae bacterium]|nr:VanW family protein [Polyangiaceae bacterium]
MSFLPYPTRRATVWTWVTAWLGVSAALSAAGLAMAAPWLRSACLWGNDACAGLRVGGETMANVNIAAALETRGRALAARSIEVTFAGLPGVKRTLTLGELGARLDVPRTMALVHGVGHGESYGDRLDAARRAANGGIDVPLVLEMDEEAARAALEPLKDATDEPPVPARIDLEHDGVVPHVSGRFLDLAGAIDRIRDAARANEGEVELPRLAVEPRVSSDFLRHVDSKKQLAKFQTYFSRHGEQSTRGQNIDTAAARLDGVVLLPHELFSFNTAVGPRTVQNGFSRGWEIFKGEMVEGIGGGTCQVASTFHAAAFLGGLDVIERLPHSRPSAYITMGLDATVVYPVVDLKIRNPYDFPVVVHSHVQGNTVAFELFGKERPAHVVFKREIVATRPYSRKVEEKKGLPRDRVVRKQHGIPGYKIKRTRLIAYGDGTSRKEENVDIYWPTFELYLVAPGVDPEPLLPPPSEGQDESGVAKWAPLPDPENPPPPPAAEAPSTTSSTLTTATAVSVAPDCADCPPTRPQVLEARGVHAPRAEQMRAPVKVIIGSGPPRP